MIQSLKDKDLAAQWMNEESYQTLSGGYLQPNETPRDAYNRVAETLSLELNKPELKSIFFDIMWKNWLCPSTPVLSNLGTKNLPISCYGGSAQDSAYELFNHNTELGMLTKYGGGVGSNYGNIRSKGNIISTGGTTDGIVPFLKMLEATINGTSQGSKRRGSVAVYLPVEHGDIEEFIQIRNPKGDLGRKCLSTSFHHAITFSDETMNKIINGDSHYRKLWSDVMTIRVETGEPYLMFRDNSNKNCPANYCNRIDHSQLCSEVFLPSTKDETFVCCLSSLNLDRYREWENWKCEITGLTLVELSILFLDAVMSVFIKQAENFLGLEKAVRFAKRHRALGLGVLGWHSLLQKEGLPFASFKAMMLNSTIFSKIQKEADLMTIKLGSEYGECEETSGTGRRNTTTLALAPTMSNSILSGGLSQGIEPITANLFTQKSAKGFFIRKNKYLENLLKEKNKNTSEIWEQINNDMGSVRNLSCLSQEEKEIFLTAREIDQYSIIQQAAQRQKYIDQGQSINLFFALPTNKEDSLRVAKYINDVHIEAWKLGIKSLYYLKTASPIKGQNLVVDKESSCLACEG